MPDPASSKPQHPYVLAQPTRKTPVSIVDPGRLTVVGFFRDNLKLYVYMLTNYFRDGAPMPDLATLARSLSVLQPMVGYQPLWPTRQTTFVVNGRELLHQQPWLASAPSAESADRPCLETRIDHITGRASGPQLGAICLSWLLQLSTLSFFDGRIRGLIEAKLCLKVIQTLGTRCELRNRGCFHLPLWQSRTFDSAS